MRLYEHEGKALFARYGIPIPNGTLLRKGNQAPPRGYPALIKAQVLSGGRGKAGAILEVGDPEAAAQHAERHVEQACKLLVRYFDESGVWTRPEDEVSG